MAQETLEKRVDRLESRIEILEQLPHRVTALESQIVQLRDEMRSEFSATRLEARSGGDEIRRTLREEIRAGDEGTRREMRELFAAAERHARILHEDVITRIAAIREDR